MHLARYRAEDINALIVTVNKDASQQFKFKLWRSQVHETKRLKQSSTRYDEQPVQGDNEELLRVVPRMTYNQIFGESLLGDHRPVLFRGVDGVLVVARELKEWAPKFFIYTTYT